MKLYVDTPKEIIKIAESLDFTAIPAIDQPIMIQQLEDIIKKYSSYIPKRTNFKVVFSYHDFKGCPKQLEDLFNRYAWNEIKPMYKYLALPFIQAWIRSNLPLRKTI